MISFYLWTVSLARDDSDYTLNTVKALINAGADVNVPDYDGQTALDIGNL